MTAVTEPITRSPLKVVMADHGMRMTAIDSDGTVVLEGVRGTRGDPNAPALVQATAGGQWTIARSVSGSAPVYDAAGVPVAEIRRGGFARTTIVTGDGTEIVVGNERLKPWFGAKFAGFGSARAPFLIRQKRSFKLKLSDELLARPDCEMLVAVFAFVARAKISSQIASAATSNATP
jgi:hypothetical protein